MQFEYLFYFEEIDIQQDLRDSANISRSLHNSLIQKLSRIFKTQLSTSSEEIVNKRFKRPVTTGYGPRVVDWKIVTQEPPLPHHQNLYCVIAKGSLAHTVTWWCTEILKLVRLLLLSLHQVSWKFSQSRELSLNYLTISKTHALKECSTVSTCQCLKSDIDLNISVLVLTILTGIVYFFLLSSIVPFCSCFMKTNKQTPIPSEFLSTIAKGEQSELCLLPLVINPAPFAPTFKRKANAICFLFCASGLYRCSTWQFLIYSIDPKPLNYHNQHKESKSQPATPNSTTAQPPIIKQSIQ